MVIGSVVDVVAPVVSKLSSWLAPCITNTGAVVSYEFWSSFPAEEKYATPLATAASIACATTPSWKNGSSG